MEGVFLKFYDARQEHPRKSGYYICCMNRGTVETLPYSRKHDVFNAYDDTPAYDAERYSLNYGVVWWAEVPPKMWKHMGVRAE